MFIFFIHFLILKQLKFKPAGNIDQPGSRWLSRAAASQIDFLLEVFMKLKPQLNALLNSRLE
jgi:hypothetical protein